jgi:predicted nucleic acid-binding protein
VKVIDASALVELLLGTPRGLHVAEALDDEEESIHMPHLADVEVAHALRRLVADKVIAERSAREAIADLQDLDIDRHAHDPLLQRIWELRGNVSAYDAAYLALTEVLDATLLTCDRRLAKTAGRTARVEVM